MQHPYRLVHLRRSRHLLCVPHKGGGNRLHPPLRIAIGFDMVLGIKRDERWVSRDVGIYVGEWVLWLTKTHVGREVLVGSSSYLQEGMARLLQGSVYASYRWHSWRRAGAAFLRWKGLPWRHLCWWGRWASVRMAHQYAAAPDESVFHPVSRLPWPTFTGVRSKSVAVEDFWPRSLINLCIQGECPERPSFTGDKCSRRDHDAPAADSEGDTVPPPSKPVAAPPRVQVTPPGTKASAISSRARKQPKVTEPGVQRSECQPPDGPEGPLASKCLEHSESSAAASGSAPSGKPLTTALSKFVGRLQGLATRARPCPKRAVGKTLRPSKQLLCRCQGTGCGGRLELPKGGYNG